MTIDEKYARINNLLDSILVDMLIEDRTWKGDVLRFVVKEMQVNPDWHTSPESRKLFADRVAEALRA